MLVLKALRPAFDPGQPEETFRALSVRLGKSESYAGRMWNAARLNLGEAMVQRYASDGVFPRAYELPKRCPRRLLSCDGGECPHTRPLHVKPDEKLYRGTRRVRASDLEGTRSYDRIGLYPPSQWWWRDRIQYGGGGASPPARGLKPAQYRKLTGDFRSTQRWYGDGPRRGACGVDEHAAVGSMAHASPTYAVGWDRCVLLSELKPKTQELLIKLIAGSEGDVTGDEAGGEA